MSDAADTPAYVIPRNETQGTHAPPGVPTKSCAARGCKVHTSDWREVPGSAGNAHKATACMRRMTLGTAARTDFATEAHLGCYTILNQGTPIDHQPRMTKDALPWLRSQGYEVVMTFFSADIDTPGHVPWTPEMRAAWERVWCEAPILQTCGGHDSPRGLRIWQPLAEPLVVEEGEARLKTWLRTLVAQGVWDTVLAVKDWTRLMRAPSHVRGGNRRVRATWIDLDRMVGVVPAEPLPEDRVRLRRVRPVTPGASNVVTLPDFTDATPPGWDLVADAVGAAIRDTVAVDWRACYLALAGAMLERGCPADGLPAVVGRAHMVDPQWADLLPSRLDIARSTALRHVAGASVAGYGTLRSRWPGVADALDATTVSGAEARVVAQLAVPAAPVVSTADAVARIEREIRELSAVVAIQAPAGTGKSTALVNYAASLPVIQDRAAPGARLAISTPTHKLARQLAAKLPGRSLRLFSPLAHTGPDGEPTCIHHAAAMHLANGGQSVAWEFCKGRKKSPCELSGRCPAEDGTEGDPHANLVVGPHDLLHQIAPYAGPRGVLAIDEPPDLVETEALTLDDLDTARIHLGSFVDRYADLIAPALAGLDAWVRTVGPVSDTSATLAHAVSQGILAAMPSDDLLRAAGIDVTLPSWDFPEHVLSAARGAILPDAKSTAPPLRWSAMAVARKNVARAIELGRASRVLNLLWRGLTAAPGWAVRVDDRSGERSAVLAGIHEQFVAALRRNGPVAVIDANASLHLAALTKVLGNPPFFVDLNVPDGAPIARSILATGSATRKAWMPRGVPAWDAVLPYLRWVMGWIAEEPTCRSVALIVPKEMEAAILFALRPDAPDARKAVADSRLSARALQAARAVLAPVLGLWSGEVLTGHFGGLEGLDHLAGCDATITLLDPRPNLGDVWDRALFLDVPADGRVDALAAAELMQAHGRLRTVHRTRPGRQLHVGSVVPAGWNGLPVTVRTMPLGRPPTIAAMDAGEFRACRVASGMGLREFARALGIDKRTVGRYEEGRAVPGEVARAVRVLVPSGAERVVENVS